MRSEIAKRIPWFDIEGMVLRNNVRPPLKASQRANDALIKMLVSRINVYRGHTLETQKEWKKRGLPIVYALNHLSNADGPVFWRTLREAEFCTDQDGPVFLVGKRLLDNPRTEFFTRFSGTIAVWPPTEKTVTPAERRKSLDANTAAMNISEKVLKNGGQLVVFLEGTRSRSGTLQTGQPTVGRYFTLAQQPENANGVPVEDTLIVPVTLKGTDERYPVGQSIPTPLTRGPVDLYFHEPLPVSSLINQYSYLNKFEMQQALVDHVMIEIAQDLPPDKWGDYTPVTPQ